MSISESLIPEKYTCPITHRIMIDPVSTSDGYVYEREAIEKWFLEKDTSPLTNLPLTDKTLRECSDLKSEIQKFIVEHSKSVPAHDGLKNNQGESSMRITSLSIPQFSDIAQMPMSPEKIIMAMLILIDKRKLGVKTLTTSDGQVVNLDETTLDQELMSLKEYCTYDISLISAAIRRGDWQASKGLLEYLLKQVSPFDIQELKKLVEKAREASKSIEDQDILLLLGRTGAGKSTTIHFLSGSKLVQQEVDGLNHIAPVDIKNETLIEVTTSPHARSETRYIRAIPVSYNEVGLEKEGGIVICDTPGFEDTQGPEVDVANSYGVVEAVRLSKSVRPVVLISNKSVGDRGELIKALAHLLVGIIANIKDHLESISFVFTKYSEKELKQVHATLKSIKSNLTIEEKSDQAFVELLDAMIEETEDNILGVNPLEDKPAKLLKSLTKRSAIRHPDRVFQFSTTEKSKAALKDQVLKHQLAIQNAVTSKHYELVGYKLNELKILIDLLNQDFVKHTYDESIRYIAKHLENQYKVAVELLNKECLDGNQLNESTIKKYLEIIAELKSAEQLRNIHLGHEVVQSAGLIQYAAFKASELIQGMEELEITSHTNIIKLKLDKLQLLAKDFSEGDSIYQAQRILLKKRVEIIIESIQRNIPLNDFPKIAEEMCALHKVKKELYDHVDVNDVKSNYEELQEKLFIHLQSIATNARDRILTDKRLEKSDIELVSKALELLQEASEIKSLADHVLRSSELVNYYSDLIKDLLEHFDEIRLKITGLFEKKRENAFDEIQLLMEELTAIHNIEVVNSKTSNLYFETIEKLCGFVKELRRDVEEQLRLFLSNADTLNCQKLGKSILILKKAAWLDKYKPGISEETLQEIRDEIIAHIETQKQTAMSRQIRLEDCSNIEEINRVMIRLQLMQALESGLPELKTFREELIGWFEDQLGKNLKLIRTLFNPDVLVLQQIESIKAEYERLVKEGKETANKNALLTLQNTENQDLNDIKAKKEAFGKELDVLSQTLSQNMADLNIKSTALKELQKNEQEYEAKIKPQDKNARNEAMAYLNKRGYRQLEELESELKAAENALQSSKEVYKRNEDRNNLLLEKIRGLDLLESNYESTLKVTGEKLEAVALEFLNSKGYVDFKVLEDAIEAKKERIESLTDKSLASSQSLADLDTAKAESVFKFFETCSKFSVLKEDFELTRQSFNSLIKTYVDTFVSEMSSFFNEIKQASETSESKAVSESAQQLLLKLRKLADFKMRAPHLFSCFPEGILNIYKQDLEEFLNELSDEMIKLQHSPHGLKPKLMLAKILSRFDYMIDGEKYLDLYIRYRDVFYSEVKVTPDILKAIRDRDYVTIASKLGGFSQINDPVTLSAVDQIKDTLTRTLNDFINDTKTQVIMLGNSIDAETVLSIQQIVANLNKIREVQHLLTKYLDEPITKELTDCVEFTKSAISNQVTRFLDSIEASVDLNNFYESDVRMGSVNQIRTLLGNYCTQDIVHKLNELTKKVENVLEEVVLRYTNISIKDYPAHPPKAIFEKFQRVRDRDQRYSRALAKIQDVVFDKCRKELDEARNYDAVPAEKNPHIRAVNTALRFLPEEWAGSLAIDLETAKEDIQTKVDQVNERVDQLIESKNITAIQVYIEKNKDRNEAVLPMRKLRESVLENVKNLKVAIDAKLEQDDITGIKEDLTDLYNYKSKLGEGFPIVNGYFHQIKNSLGKILVHWMKSITDGIADGDDISPSSSFNDVVTFMERNIIKLTLMLELNSELSAKSQDNSVDLVSLSDDIFPDDFFEKIEQMNKKLTDHLQEFLNKYLQGLREMNSDFLLNALNGAKKWDGFLKRLKPYIHASAKHDVSILADVISKLKYVDMLDSTKGLINQAVESIVRIDLLNEKIVMTKKLREELYTKLNGDLQVLLRSRNLKNHFDSKSFDIDRIIKESTAAIHNKIDFLLKESNKLINKKVLSRDDYEMFNRLYNSIVSLDKCVPLLNSVELRISEELKKLEDIIFDRVSLIENQVVNAASIEEVAASLVNIKIISDGIVAFKSKIDSKIDSLLNEFKRKRGGQDLAKLGSILNSEPTGIGQVILAEHKCFVGYSVHLFNTKTQRHNIDYVIDNIDGDEVDRVLLRERYREFNQKYQNLVMKYLKNPIDFEAVRTALKTSLEKVDIAKGGVHWTARIRDAIPELLAYILGLWTLKNADHYFDAEGNEDRNSYLLQPHAAQVISIFRMLCIDESKSTVLKNNLVQIGTGEGKSVTLAATAATLALLGFDVSCACYSDYLSTRDYNEFLWLFEDLDILDRVHYGTFNKLCEEVINERGNIRDIVKGMVSNEKQAASVKKVSLNRPKILLVDEVDVFFSKDFYGNVYTPSSSLVDPTISNLTDFIWAQKDSINFSKIKNSPEYKACCAKYKNWEFLIEEAVKDMLADLKTFMSHDYIISNDRIGYKEQDRIVFNMVIGYKTLFAYYYQHQMGRVSEKSLRENISISINCGNFSYAEVPHNFKNIMGVTGTLRTLSEPEKNIVKNVYGIQKNTYIPSVFGINNLVFRPDADIKIENTDDFYNVIQREISDRLIGQTPSSKRAVLVFFESKEKLMGFYNSPAVSGVKDTFSIMTEEVDDDNKLSLIKKATNTGRVTLLTKSFGRGTDFVSRDQVVSANGGVHVVQTFLSAEVSEETQIKGRTARQGDHGSYSMVLLDKSLECFLITVADIDAMKSNGKFYSVLNEKRNKYFEEQYAQDTKFVEQAKKEHESAMKFVLSLESKDTAFIRNYLGQYNKGAAASSRSRTIVLMDATGSMSHLLQKAKNTVGMMFERAGTVLTDNGIPSDSFEMQFSVYRNYNAPADSLLQSSGWETKPSNLRNFMDKISAGWGLGPEAIEIGLWHVNEETKNGEVSQVILIGDAPANAQAQVSQFRGIHGEAYWRTTKFPVPTFYETEVSKLRQEKIPVHAYYVNNYAQTMFKQIANSTGGRSEFLDVNSSQGAEALTNLVTEEVLRSVGGEGKGKELVEAYRTKYARSYRQ